MRKRTVLFLLLPIATVSIIVCSAFGLWTFGQGATSPERQDVEVTDVEDRSIRRLYAWFGANTWEQTFKAPYSDQKENMRQNPYLQIDAYNVNLPSPLKTRAYLTPEGNALVKKLTYQIELHDAFAEIFNVRVLKNAAEELPLTGTLEVPAGSNSGTTNGIDGNYVEFDPLTISITYKPDQRPYTEKAMGKIIQKINAIDTTANPLIKVNLVSSFI